MELGGTKVCFPPASAVLNNLPLLCPPFCVATRINQQPVNGGEDEAEEGDGEE